MRNRKNDKKFIVEKKESIRVEKFLLHGEKARQCVNLCEIIEEKLNRITFDVERKDASLCIEGFLMGAHEDQRK